MKYLTFSEVLSIDDKTKLSQVIFTKFTCFELKMITHPFVEFIN